MMSDNRYVFFDLDETLIQAEYNNFNKRRKRVDITWDCDGIQRSEAYGVILREGALELLSVTRRLYPNVYMLTASVSCYAQKINEVFNLGFKPEEIITRDMYLEGHNFINNNIKSVLVDNQRPVEVNAIYKQRYLKRFGTVGYVEVNPFYGHSTGGITDGMKEQILNDIANEFNIQ